MKKTINERNKVHKMRQFNESRMRIEVDVPFYFRDWNSGLNLFEEVISSINADYP